jgi:hypothetical protein
MRYEVKKIQLDKEFKICPTCSYRDGFHSMYKRIDDEIRVFSICPSCHDVFDVNLSLNLSEKKSI